MTEPTPVAVQPVVLVGCSHGTRDVGGRRVVADLLLRVGARRPGLVVRAAFVDVQPPTVDDVVRDVTASGATAVVVPLLLSAGFHVHVDVARAVGTAVGQGFSAVAAGALGPDPALVEVLLDRLAEAHVDPARPVVLAAVGSSDPRSVRDVESVVRLLGSRRPGAVTAGYGSAASPTVAEAVAAARAASSGPVAVAGYLLAPGFFHDRLRDVGADAVTAPIGADDRVAALVLARFDAALAALRPVASRA